MSLINGWLLGLAMAMLPVTLFAATDEEIAEYLNTPAELLSVADLNALVGPIALYPDDLVALALPASTYPLQVVQAARFLRAKNRAAPDDDWDDAVVALLNYPEVMTLLNEDLDWLWSLGSAFISQPEDVFAAIQSFRYEALAAGNLLSDDKQVIQLEDSVITIRSRFQDQVYVPYYEPQKVVSYQSRPVYHYHEQVYPTYYYPYSAGYTYSHAYFYGIPSFYAIGWGSSYLYNYHPEHHRHPYYRSRLIAHYGYGNYFRHHAHRNHTPRWQSQPADGVAGHAWDRFDDAPETPVWQSGRRAGGLVGGAGIGIDRGAMQTHMRAAKAAQQPQTAALAPQTVQTDRDRGRRVDPVATAGSNRSDRLSAPDRLSARDRPAAADSRPVIVTTTRSRVVYAGQQRSAVTPVQRPEQTVTVASGRPLQRPAIVPQRSVVAPPAQRSNAMAAATSARQVVERAERQMPSIEPTTTRGSAPPSRQQMLSRGNVRLSRPAEAATSTGGSAARGPIAARR